MKRKAVKPNTLPSCYGLSHMDDAECNSCKVEHKCVLVCNRWCDRLSLREVLQEAEAELQDSWKTQKAQDTGTEDAVEVYIRLYRLYLSDIEILKPRSVIALRSGKARAVLEKVRQLCQKEELDYEVWITANMIRRKESASRSPYGFQPNWLSSDAARGHYNAFIRQKYRRLRVNTAQEAGDGHGQMKKVRELVESEIAVAEMYVSAALRGETLTWKEAADGLDASIDWKANRGTKEVWAVVRLRAAIQVLSSYNTQYPKIIGVKLFSWDAVIRVLKTLLPTVRQQDITTTGDNETLGWRTGNGRGHNEYV